MNMKPGGKQPAMRETQWGSRPQKDGRPKGMKIILEERGIHTETLNVDNMRTILSNHDDFREGKSLVEHFLANRGHTVMFIPKFHCELNPIERVWGQEKVYTRTYTNFTIQRLRRIINPALDSVSPDLIAERRWNTNEPTSKARKLAGNLSRLSKCINHTAEFLSTRTLRN